MAPFFPNGPLRTKEKSARDIVNAALESGPEPLCERPKGLYLNGSEVGVRNPEAKDPANGAMVWWNTVWYAGLKEGETCLKDWR